MTHWVPAVFKYSPAGQLDTHWVPAEFKIAHEVTQAVASIFKYLLDAHVRGVGEGAAVDDPGATCHEYLRYYLFFAIAFR